MRYRNQHFGFELELPAGWSEPGFFKKVFSAGRYAQQSMHPEFYGHNNSSIKIASGPISPGLSAKQQKSNLEKIAQKYGHDVIELDTINVGGINHATMLCRIPGVGVIKNYSLIFGSMEYLITAQGDWEECDSIIKTFKLTSKQI